MQLCESKSSSGVTENLFVEILGGQFFTSSYFYAHKIFSGFFFKVKAWPDFADMPYEC